MGYAIGRFDGSVSGVTQLPQDLEALFRTFLDNSPILGFIADADDRLVYSSEPVPLLEEQVGLSMWDLVPPQYHQPYRQAVQRTRETAKTQVVLAPGLRYDGAVTGLERGLPGWVQAHYFLLPEGWVGGVAMDVTELVETQEELTRSRKRIVAAGDTARRRIERDLHDGVQQRLVAQLVRLRLVGRRLDRDPEAAAELLEECATDLEETIQELRELARGIHPTVLTRSGLAAALGAVASRVSIPVRLDCLVEHRPSAEIEAAAYFVCSEALTNIEKHAGATSAEVNVRETQDGLALEVSDDGVGGVRVREGGGIEGLRDRVEALGGALRVRERDGGGTVLGATLPA